MTTALAVGLVAVCAALVARELASRRLRADLARHEDALARVLVRLEHVERAFQRFAPQDLVEHIASGRGTIEPSHRKVTVMFADLKGFTAMSERIPPAEMIEILNGYFTAMNEALHQHHGHLSRLMGDGLMALFGAIDDNPWQEADAVRAALAMRSALDRYNAELAALGRSPLAFGVGVHTGEVVAGVMGSDQLVEFTVIGDAVNTAARVEALTRHHGVDILVTGPVRDALDGAFRLRAMPPTALKGKTEPVATWAVEGPADRI